MRRKIKGESMTDDQPKAVGTGVGLGVALGAAFGAAFGNVGIGVALGIALGAAFGSLVPVPGGSGGPSDAEGGGEDDLSP